MWVAVEDAEIAVAHAECARRPGGRAAGGVPLAAHASPASWTGCCAWSADCPTGASRTDAVRLQVAEVIGAARDVQAAALRAGSDATEPQVRSLVRHARDEVDIVSTALSRHALGGAAPLRSAPGRHGPPAAPAKLNGCPQPRRPEKLHRPRRGRAHGAPGRRACSARASPSAWRRRATRSRAASTATASRTTTGPAGRARAGSRVPDWRATSGATPRRRWTVPPPSGATPSGSRWSGRGSSRARRVRRGRARALRRDPLPVRGAGHGAHGHAAPLHPPVVAGRGVLAATRLARRLRPPRRPGRAGAGAVLPALGDGQRAQHRDAHGVDRGGVPARAGAWPSPTPSASSTTS